MSIENHTITNENTDQNEVCMNEINKESAALLLKGSNKGMKEWKHSHRRGTIY